MTALTSVLAFLLVGSAKRNVRFTPGSCESSFECEKLGQGDPLLASLRAFVDTHSAASAAEIDLDAEVLTCS